MSEPREVKGAAASAVPSKESAALTVLGTLVKLFGPDMLSGIVDILTGGAGTIVDELSEFASGVLGPILTTLGEGALRAALKEAYAAAEIPADVAEDAKFPRGEG